MDFPIQYPDFEGQNLVVRSGGFSAPKLLQNGIILKGEKRIYRLKSNAGTEVMVQLKPTFIDPAPKVIIDKNLIHLAEPLKCYEYVWVGFPILLMFIGGAMGSLIGGFAAYTNGKIFRSDRSNFAKYAITGLISVGAVIGYLILVTILQLTVFAKHS